MKWLVETFLGQMISYLVDLLLCVKASCMQLIEFLKMQRRAGNV